MQNLVAVSHAVWVQGPPKLGDAGASHPLIYRWLIP